MKILVILIAILATLTLTAQDIVNSINGFGFDLLREVKTKDQNVVVSPYSVYTALAMTAEGADKETLTQMKKILNLTEINDASIKLGELQNKLQNAEKQNIELSLANALWLDDQFELKSEFKRVIKEDFKAELHQSALKKETQVLKEINKWVSDQTNKKIPSILDELDPLTKLVLLNAIYFKGEWKWKFMPEVTLEEDFQVNNEDKMKVQMMHQITIFPFYEDELVQAIQMQYKESDYSMLIILPYDLNDMDRLLKELNADYFNQIAEAVITRERIDVSLPKYKIDYKRELSEDLKTLGMPIAFTKAADFSRINSKADLFIDQVQHRAFIDVNEKGAEAAAATAVSMRLTSSGPPADPIEFLADHPFIFLLKEDTSNLILFAGIINKPQ